MASSFDWGRGGCRFHVFNFFGLSSLVTETHPHRHAHTHLRRRRRNEKIDLLAELLFEFVIVTETRGGVERHDAGGWGTLRSFSLSSMTCCCSSSSMGRSSSWTVGVNSRGSDLAFHFSRSPQIAAAVGRRRYVAARDDDSTVAHTTAGQVRAGSGKGPHHQGVGVVGARK